MPDITVVKLFTDIANAIRTKKQTSSSIVADRFPYELANIPDNMLFISILNKTITNIPDVYLYNFTSIGSYAFFQCTNLALTSLPEGITSIGSYAFFQCTNLALTSLPEGIIRIGDSTFYRCTNLALTSLPESITNIGNAAFYRCTNLRTITFKGTPTSIVSSAFQNCINLTTINVPWSEGAVANAPWGATNATINYNYTGG